MNDMTALRPDTEVTNALSTSSKQGKFHCCQSFLPPHIFEEIKSRIDSKSNPDMNEILTKTEEITKEFSSRLRSMVPQTNTSLVNQDNGIAKISIYNAKNNPDPMSNGEKMDPSEYEKDIDAQFVYIAIRNVLMFLKEVVGRNSVDNQGQEIIGVIHTGKDFDNAFWDGTHYHSGDGDWKFAGEVPAVFECFSRDLSVAPHEIGHGVVQHEGKFNYADQPGALNESFADVVSVCTRQWIAYKNGDDSKNIWEIGKDLILPTAGQDSKIHHYALRTFLDAPAYKDHPWLGTDPQPKNMKNYKHMGMDNGGVHINSGITNHAFYLVSEKIGGNAWDKPFKIWYQALCDLKGKTNTNFQQFADATSKAAVNKFGKDSPEAKAVAEGWQGAGITISEPSTCTVI